MMRCFLLTFIFTLSLLPSSLHASRVRSPLLHTTRLHAAHHQISRIKTTTNPQTDNPQTDNPQTNNPQTPNPQTPNPQINDSHPTDLHTKNLHWHHSNMAYWRNRTKEVNSLCDYSLWKSYTNFHNQKRNKKETAMLISLPTETGFDNLFASIITELYWAMFSSRLFFIMPFPHLPNLSRSLRSRYINWTYEEKKLPHHLYLNEDTQNLLQLKRFFEKRGDSFAALVTDFHSSLYFNEQNLSSSHVPSSSSSSSLSHQRLYVLLNRGRTSSLFDNKYHTTHIQQLGLSLRTAYLCGFEYLFQPNIPIRAFADPYISQIQSSDIRIAIAIQMNDSLFKEKKNGDFSIVNQYYNCAKMIELWATESLLHTNRTVSWYLMSDSLLIKEYAKREWSEKGNRTILFHNFLPLNLNCKKSDCLQNEMAYSLVSTMAQMYTFSSADYFVMEAENGFGVESALLSTAEDVNIFWYNQSCVKENRLPLSVVAKVGAGI
jgi:hypothetical protein